MTTLAPRRRAIFSRRAGGRGWRCSVYLAAALLVAAISFAAGFSAGLKAEGASLRSTIFAAAEAESPR